MVVHIWKPSTLEPEAQEWWMWRQAGLQSKLWASMDYNKILSKTYKRVLERSVVKTIHSLTLQRTWVQDPAPILGDSQSPITLDPGDPMPSSGSGALGHRVLAQVQDKFTWTLSADKITHMCFCVVSLCWNKLSLCSPEWPRTHDPPVSIF